MNGVELQAIDVDLSGMQPPESGNTPPRLIFVTPLISTRWAAS
jgi:GntR family transcriptional regulator/MocR family aminotransferase